MASASLTEAWISSADFSDRYKLRTTKHTVEDNRFAEEIPNNIDTSYVKNKVDFLRSMGLEFSNFCDINYNNNNNNNDYDLQSSYKRSCSTTNPISESFDHISKENFDWISKRTNSKNRQTREMVGYQKIIPFMKECRVTIIGEKCKVCGRSYKCIKDLQIHIKKKHRKRKPRKKLVIKIGSEVISRVPIKRKHLKCLHKQKHKTIDSRDDATSFWNEDENGCDHISDEGISPFVDLDNNCNTKETWPRLMDKSNTVLQSSENKPRHELAKHRKDEDEDIQVLLKITRPRQLMEINHETPNRTERELLLTDAIQELFGMDSDLAEVIEPNRDLQIYREDSEIIEEFSRLADNRLQNCNLDSEEHNCSFHIENEDDIDCCGQDINSLLPENNDILMDDTTSTHSPHYRNENGDIIPDFIDYTHCLKDRATLHNNNNNDSVYEFENSFYNEAPINEWNKPNCDPNIGGFDVLQNTSRSLDSSVLIKEEIMLEDFL